MPKGSAGALGRCCGSCFLPGSWPCLSINKAASFQTLPFPGHVSCQIVFLSRFEASFLLCRKPLNASKAPLHL